MRVLGLDIGEVRIGVAVSDPAGRVATPVAVIDARRALGDGVELSRIAEDYEAELVVVGLPLSLDGTEGSQARRVRNLAERLARFLPLPFVFADERLSSVAAEKALDEAGVSAKDRRGTVDKLAASIILQTWLDDRAEKTGGET